MSQAAFTLESMESTTFKQTNNYDFIEYRYPELFALSQQVEQYYATDHSCCLLKMRLFVELWCHEAGEKLKLRPPVSGELVAKIRQLSESGKVAPYIVKILDVLRLEGNRSAHISRRHDGSWKSDSSIAKAKLTHYMRDMHDLAKYLAFTLSTQQGDHSCCDEFDESVAWVEPQREPLAEHVYQSLAGNVEATLALAERCSLMIQLALLKGADAGFTVKEQVQSFQRDLAYWLEKAHRQGHKETWLMYARVYIAKQLQLPKGLSIDTCFKNALKTDESGEAAFEFSGYLVRDGQQDRSLMLLKQAGEKQFPEAIRKLQSHYYNADSALYHKWVTAGMAAEEKGAFTADLFGKLLRWQQDQGNELLLKQLRSAMISAESRQAAGVAFIRGYCDFNGYLIKEALPAKGLAAMAEHYKALPEFLPYEAWLFDAAKTAPEHDELAIEVFNKALLQTADSSKKALMKFEIAILIRDKLAMQNGGRIKSPGSIKHLLRESAKEGCELAIQYIASPSGKALMRDDSYVSVSVRHKVVDRVKLKKAKKAARKAKR
jgi:hypothetical protein